MADPEKLAFAATIVANYLRHNAVGVDRIGTVIAEVAHALEGAARRIENRATAEEGAGAAGARLEPTVPVRRSMGPDYLVCLECGRSATTLKRHLQTAHGMTPKQYRDRWALKPDYPMTAPSYSARRSQLAKARGLGRRPSAA